MSRVSLAELFEQLRPNLVTALGTNPDPQHVLKALRVVFDHLGDAVAAEPAEAADRAKLMLDALRGGVVGTFFALRPAPPVHTGQRARPRQQSKGPIDWGISLLSGKSERTQEAAPPAEPEPVERSSTVDVTRLLDQLRGSFEAADRLLAAAEPPPPVVVRTPWSEDSELLDLCQDLLEAQSRADGTLALSHVERVRRSLPQQHQIDVVTFDGDNEDLFKFRTHADPDDTETVMIRPALVSGDQVLRFGEVHRPAGSTPQDAEERGDLHG